MSYLSAAGRHGFLQWRAPRQTEVGDPAVGPRDDLRLESGGNVRFVYITDLDALDRTRRRLNLLIALTAVSLVMSLALSLATLWRLDGMLARILGH